MTHEELRDLIPAYALDAIDPAMARAVEAHLPTCEECRRDLSGLRVVAAELAAGVAAVEPPSWVGADVPAAAQPGRRWALPPRLWSAGWAVAAAVILVLGGVALYQAERLRTLTAHIGALSARLTAQERVLAVLASPAARTATLGGSVQANVRFVYDRATSQGALIVTDLRDPGPTFVYQLWLMAGQGPQSAGVFRPIPGQPTIIPVSADFRRYEAVAVSVERAPRGSSVGPTTAPILVGTI